MRSAAVSDNMRERFQFIWNRSRRMARIAIHAVAILALWFAGPVVAGLVVAGLVVAGPVVAGPFEDGLAAYQRDDRETALREWRPLAEQGDAVAQYYLGLMHDTGEAFHVTMKWYRKAAEQGVPRAQYNLGIMYSFGLGVASHDLVEAHKWFDLAVMRGNVAARAARDHVAESMTAAEIGEAERRARHWKPCGAAPEPRPCR